MKKYKALIHPKDETPKFWHYFEALDFYDAKDFINQFCSLHLVSYTELQEA